MGIHVARQPIIWNLPRNLPPMKRPTAKSSKRPRKHSRVAPNPKSVTPSGRTSRSDELGQQTLEDLLRYAVGLEHLGIPPAELLRQEFLAEEAVRRLATSVPPREDPVAYVLRTLVEDPLLVDDVDALDSPSLREQLKAARTYRLLFGRKPDPSLRLDPCGKALCLEPRPGRQPTPAFEVHKASNYYTIYLWLMQAFTAVNRSLSAKKAPWRQVDPSSAVPSQEEIKEEAVRYFRQHRTEDGALTDFHRRSREANYQDVQHRLAISEEMIAAEDTRAEKWFEEVCVPALARQMRTFLLLKRKGRSVRKKSDCCALALVEILKSQQAADVRFARCFVRSIQARLRRKTGPASAS